MPVTVYFFTYTWINQWFWTNRLSDWFSVSLIKTVTPLVPEWNAVFERISWVNDSKIHLQRKSLVTTFWHNYCITCRKSHWKIPPLTHSLSGTCKHRQVEWYEKKWVSVGLTFIMLSVFSSNIYTILVTRKMPFANSLHPTMFISNISQGDVSVNDRYHAWLLNLRLTLSLIKRLKLVHACFVCDEICKRKFLYAGQISSHAVKENINIFYTKACGNSSSKWS